MCTKNAGERYRGHNKSKSLKLFQKKVSRTIISMAFKKQIGADSDR